RSAPDFRVALMAASTRSVGPNPATSATFPEGAYRFLPPRPVLADLRAELLAILLAEQLAELKDEESVKTGDSLGDSPRIAGRAIGAMRTVVKQGPSANPHLVRASLRGRFRFEGRRSIQLSYGRTALL